MTQEPIKCCGKKAPRVSMGYDEWSVLCENCYDWCEEEGHSGSIVWAKEKSDAIDEWNQFMATNQGAI